MFWIIVIAIVVLVVLFKLGIFRKAGECKCCGKKLKGTEQMIFGFDKTRFILCKECAAKIHPQIADYAKKNWKYEDYTDYLAWEEETKEERAQFKATEQYGYASTLMIDSEHGLFTLGKGRVFKESEAGLIFRFADLVDWDLNFKAEKVKDGLLGIKVKGDEFAMIQLDRPNVLIEEILNYGASYPLRKKGILSSKYEYEFSGDFQEIMAAFSICEYIELAKQEGECDEEERDFDEIQKALALFMFDSMADATPDNLKKQRNALIKAFHPDFGEDNATYAAKINNAYELLRKLAVK